MAKLSIGTFVAPPLLVEKIELACGTGSVAACEPSVSYGRVHFIDIALAPFGLWNIKLRLDDPDIFGSRRIAVVGAFGGGGRRRRSQILTQREERHQGPS